MQQQQQQLCSGLTATALLVAGGSKALNALQVKVEG